MKRIIPIFLVAISLLAPIGLHAQDVDSQSEDAPNPDAVSVTYFEKAQVLNTKALDTETEPWSV